jgi:HPt (histidine-containing phosphotransfer) domain-containing protein
MNIQIPGIDIKKGLDLYDDDEDIYLAVLRSYLDNTPEVLNIMRNVSAETLSEYTVAAHGVKGTSTNIGAEEIRKEALELELMGKAGDLNGILARNEAFLKKADELISNIQSWLKKFGS